jgi:hypothetical protein
MLTSAAHAAALTQTVVRCNVLGLNSWHNRVLQALKANPECAVRELKLNANYITRFGQVALTEAVDMVYEMGGGKMLTVTF